MSDRTQQSDRAPLSDSAPIRDHASSDRGATDLAPPGGHEPSELSEQLHVLAQYCGIAVSYLDGADQLVEVQDATLQALLTAFDVDTSSVQAAREAAERLRLQAARRCLPPVVAAEQGITTEIVLRLPAGCRATVWVELEDGGTVDLSAEQGLPPADTATAASDEQYAPQTVDLPTDLPLGYHTVHLTFDNEAWAAHLIVSPSFLGFPATVTNERVWGFATQLYSVPSRRSWGMGDLSDLRELVTWSGSEHGADYLLINPMNAAAPLPPIEPSPYLPVSRRFFDPQYLRVEDVAEYAQLSKADADRCARLRERAGTGRSGPGLLDRDTAWTAKREALTLLFGTPRSAEREADFAAFTEREGVDLLQFATWCALAETYGPDTSVWPVACQDAGSPEVQQFAAAHAPSVEFHRWLQWLLDQQLARVHRAARDVMDIGVIHDLPVGVHPDGADTWSARELYAGSVSVGAPPDAFNQLGQDWSQHPWRPDRLAENGYAPFRTLVSGILRHSGGLRVDHIIGLFRLWWIPRGHGATNGSYVRYDHEVLIGIAALEAHRAGAVVIGEDLGTFEPSVQEYLLRRGVPGTSVLWFEMDDGVPIPPERWREWCFASVTTHDLPPAACLVTGDHVRLRGRLGLLTGDLDEEVAREHEVLERWTAELERTGCIAAGAGPQDIVDGLHRYLTLTPCRLLNVSLTDAVGDRHPQNVPGTTDAYPNWRYQIAGPDGAPLFLEDVLTSPAVARLAGILRRAGRTPTIGNTASETN